MTKKIILIIQREYLSRVKKRSFWIMSLIAPLMMGALIFVPIWLSTMEGEQKVVAVINALPELEESWEDYRGISWEPVAGNLEEQRDALPESDYYALLYIPQNFLEEGGEALLYVRESLSLETKMDIRRALQRKAEALRLQRAGIQTQTLKEAKKGISMQVASLKKKEDQGDEEESAVSDGGVSPEAASGVGYFASFLIYFFVFFSGAQVMRGVVEEKSSRIVEVIISSVKPFELMMGKIVGIGGVVLTQLIIWAALLIAIQVGVSTFIDAETVAAANMPAEVAENAQLQTNDTVKKAEQVIDALGTLNFPLIIGSLFFYFIGAYLFYGSLFAAVGAASDSETDSQQMTLPISLPLIASIMMAIYVIREPQSALAFWSSIIPFTSPIVMMTRIPFGVPAWELILSMVILVLSFLATTWLAGKIYRIGILMYGKKVSYADLWRWIRQSN